MWEPTNRKQQLPTLPQEYNRYLPPPIRFRERFSSSRAGVLGADWMEGKALYHRAHLCASASCCPMECFLTTLRWLVGFVSLCKVSFWFPFGYALPSKKWIKPYFEKEHRRPKG